MSHPDTIKGMDAVDLFCARHNVLKSDLTASEQFAIKHEKKTQRLNKDGCWYFLLLLVIILLFEMLAAPLVFEINCSEPNCMLIPPGTDSAIRVSDNLRVNTGSMMNMTWNSSHIVM